MTITTGETSIECVPCFQDLLLSAAEFAGLYRKISKCMSFAEI
jgi:hypothetical protein